MSVWQWMCCINGYNEANTPDDAEAEAELSEDEKAELFELVKVNGNARP